MMVLKQEQSRLKRCELCLIKRSWCKSMGRSLSIIHTSSVAVIKPLEGLFSRELLPWLIYSCNNLFPFTPYAHFDAGKKSVL